MAKTTTDVAFTEAVKAQQERLGSRASYERWSENRGFSREITPELVEFLETRTSVYLGTASGDGRPYIQHRGGPAGFLRAIDTKTIAFADYPGNRQYISIGNLSENPKAFLFLMDYANAIRIKIWGTATFNENVEDTAGSEAPDGTAREILFHVEAWDKNCRQHIPRLVPSIEVEELREQVVTLEKKLRELQGPAA